MIDRRKSLSKLYMDICDVCELSDSDEWVPVYSNVLCKLSKKSLNDVNQTRAQAEVSDSMVLFLDDRIGIKAGSKVLCRGLTFYAGMPFVYSGSHQEVPLLYEGYA